MWIIKKLLGSNGKPDKVEATQSEQFPALQKNFQWSEDLRPFETIPHAVIRVFRLKSDRITIIIPGYGSSGRKPKYEDAISAIMEQGHSAVISTNNLDPFGNLKNYSYGIKAQVDALIQYALQNAIDLTGKANVKITLYGSSAGGGAVALAAGYFPEIVDSIILTGPSQDVTEGLKDDLLQIVKPFYGRIFLISTADDKICDSSTIERYTDLLNKAVEFNIKKIPGDDHAFNLPQSHSALTKFVIDSLTALRALEP